MKPVLVLSPSLGTTTALWDPQLDAFSEHFTVVRHDLPGHGAAAPPEGPVTVESIARSVLALLDERGVERASFCGLSIGGMIAMWIGARAPERVERLALCCTGAQLGSPEAFRERAALVRERGTAVVVDGARERWFTPAFADSPVARRTLDELAAISPEGYAACCEAVGAFDFHDELSAITAPTLVVVGEEDPVTPPEVVDSLVGGIAGARLAVVPGAAHLANLERPTELTSAVLAHLLEAAAA